MKPAIGICAVLLGSLAATAQATDLNSKTVSFAFAWEPGLSGTGETKVSGTAARVPGSIIRFTFVTDGVGENLRVRHLLTGFSPEPTNDESELFARMTGAVTEPDILVSNSGRFVGLQDVGALRAALRADVSDTFERKHMTRPDSTNFDRYIETATAQPRLEGRLAEDWHRRVSRWIGVRARVGNEYQINDVVMLPIAGQAQPKLTMHGTYTITQLQPCVRARVSRVCAVIQMHLQPDGEDLDRVTNEVYGKATDGKPKPGSVQAMTVSVDAEVVTEPDGLVTHRYTISKHIEMNLSDDGKSVQRMSDERETTYLYP
ncbi:MAG TPA: hypothetical protein VE046_06520 [Steroidobacteraceae bacterium]|nr:hypothetical protein [Steroidobacteraceae bacterium]